MADRILVIMLGALLLICAIQDLLKKRIYLWVICMGGITTVVCSVFVDNLGIMDRVGGLLVGLAIMLLSKITAGGIGMGDGILLCITGLGLGFWCNLELFGLALFLAAMISIILLILRRVDRKQTIPFVPFLFAGYLILSITSNGAFV